MKSARLDKTVMLLSADWFMPSWSAIGLSFDGGKKILLQEGSREIVKQIMAGAQQYWLIDFSPARVAVTRAKLQALLDRAAIGPISSGTFATLIGEEEPTGIDEGDQWLVVSITEQQLDGSLPEHPLSPPLQQLLNGVQVRWNQHGLNSDGFDQACMSSTSAWDQYLRNCTPDIPSMLSDYASSLVSQIKFYVLWQTVNSGVPSQQRGELFDWYRAVARSLDDIDLPLPSR